jgi:Resolvase, N terminal domain
VNSPALRLSFNRFADKTFGHAFALDQQSAENYCRRAMNQLKTHSLGTVSLGGIGGDALSVHALVRYTLLHGDPAQEEATLLLRRLLDTLAPGGVVTVTRLDRLARSTRDLLNTLATITGKKAGFRSLGDTWADTTTAHGRLMLTVLGGLAEFERDLIRTRTGEGRARAKARGVKLGRKPRLTPHQQREAIKRRNRGEETLAEIGRSYNVSGWTISRLMA